MTSLLPAVRRLAEGVQNPIQYLGGELNAVVKDPDTVSARMVLCYPDVYEIGASHNGSQVLYSVLNAEPDLSCERAYTPWPDMASAMREAGVPLFSLETHEPVSSADVLGFTLQTELTYSNVLETLDLAGLPIWARERDASHPIVIAGGHGAHSPEVLAEFVDVFLPGDGEETLPLFLRKVAELRAANTPREELLHELARSFAWAYVPAMYDAAFDGKNGAFNGLTPRFSDVPKRIQGAAVFDFSAVPIATHPIVPFAKTVHETISLEIMRGCTRGCRFCQAGMITRPMRYRRVEDLVAAAEEAIANTGYDEITLTSLSSGDYPWIEELITEMNARFAPRGVSVSLPSLRVTGELARLPGLTNGVRKGALTFAPEVATDRLRKIINKDIRNEDMLTSARAAYAEGWSKIKIYYMIGIPGEMEEDLRAVVEFADELSRLRREVTGKGKAQINVTVTTFVPKAFVPFQWDGMMDRETVREKQNWMRGLNRNRSVKLKFHDAEQSYLEGVLARGDRRLAPGIAEAWKRGARFDAWSEHADLDRWLDAFDAQGIDPDAFALRERGEHEALPWDHLDIGPAREYLWAERERARQLIKTDYCVGKVCHVCGVPPSLCFAIKRDMGLLDTQQRGILEIDEEGLTKGVAGVDKSAARTLRATSPGPVRAHRRARDASAAGSVEAAGSNESAGTTSATQENSAPSTEPSSS
ncbi:MAG: B12-binding domain-containing radical SAM protein [Planctomycetota bacterium]|nr:MAG: B12-binding domain-containing radical SAM protein [Planctomycetota bacterium]